MLLFKHTAFDYVVVKLFWPSNQTFFLGLGSLKNYYTRPGGGVGIWEGSLGCEFFCLGGCVLREWVVEGGGLYGYFGEQGLPAGI